MRKIFKTAISINFRDKNYGIDGISIKREIDNDAITAKIYYKGDYIGTYDEEKDYGFFEKFERLSKEEKELNKEFNEIYQIRLAFIEKIIADIKAYHFDEEIEDFQISSFRIESEEGKIRLSPITNDMLWEQIDEICYDYEDETHKLFLEDTLDEKGNKISLIRIAFNDGYDLRWL